MRDVLTSIATRAGCSVRVVAKIDVYGRDCSGLALECHDNERAVALLNALAVEVDGTDPEVVELARSIRADAPTMPAFAAAVQDYVKARVRFVTEPFEIFQGAMVTFARGAGDCDDHARTVCGLLVAGGEWARIIGVRNSRGQVAHVCAQVLDASGWTWVETTVDARYGEPPIAAAVRLGLSSVQRPDVLGGA